MLSIVTTAGEMHVCLLYMRVLMYMHVYVFLWYLYLGIFTCECKLYILFVLLLQTSGVIPHMELSQKFGVVVITCTKHVSHLSIPFCTKHMHVLYMYA